MDRRDMMDTSDLTARRRFWTNVRWLVSGLVLGILCSALWNQCRYHQAGQTPEAAVSQQPMESYQVISHDATSGEWVILAVNREEARRVQVTVVCDFYESGDREPVRGASSCDLLVGRMMIPNRLGTRPGDFLDVWQLGDALFITEGKGRDRVHQQFSVRSAKVLQ